MSLDQNKTPLFDAIIAYTKRDIAPMFMPAHMMGRAINPKWTDFAGENIFKMDICEVDGLDDLNEPDGVIMEAQRLAAQAWAAKESFFMVNGTSGANIAAICSVVSEGETIIVPRNCHKSVIYGLIISGAVPVFAFPDVSDELGLIGGMDPAEIERVYGEHPEAKAVLSVVPTYHGVYSDLNAISEIVHKRGGVHMVDEAHGNHVYFHDKYPAGGLCCGADLVTQSTHKVSGSLSQSSMVHVNSDRIDLDRLRFNLQMAQNTSPSALLEVSLDLARHYMAVQGEGVLQRVYNLVEYGKAEIESIEGFSVLDRRIAGSCHIFDMEPGRLVISAKDLGVTGYALERALIDDYGIQIEFSDNFYVVCMVGLGGTRSDLDRLIAACREISVRHKGEAPLAKWRNKLPKMAEAVMTPRQAYVSQTEKIPWEDACGRISAEMIVPYPPGIPAICPGERINDEILRFLGDQNEQGRHLHGIHGGTLDMVRVVK